MIQSWVPLADTVAKLIELLHRPPISSSRCSPDDKYSYPRPAIHSYIQSLKYHTILCECVCVSHSAEWNTKDGFMPPDYLIALPISSSRCSPDDKYSYPRPAIHSYIQSLKYHTILCECVCVSHSAEWNTKDGFMPPDYLIALPHARFCFVFFVCFWNIPIAYNHRK